LRDLAMLAHYIFNVASSISFHDTALTEIYTLSLHDALPICPRATLENHALPNVPGEGIVTLYTGTDRRDEARAPMVRAHRIAASDRKSTRLNSSHVKISYAVFCLKKKNKKKRNKQH